MRGLLLSQMLTEFRIALRMLRRRPGFATAVILTLALGIGTSTAVFSLLNAALLRPLPFAEPARLAMIWGVFGDQRDIGNVRGASPAEITDWRTLNRSFTDVAAYDEISLNLRTTGDAQRIDAEMVSAAYFDILGVTASRGRTFLAEEDLVPDARPVAVVSDAFWRARFGADPAIVGKSITLNDRPFTIVGVMKPEFRGISFDTDVWVPMMMISLTSSPSTLEARGNRWLGAVGRLRPGIPWEAAQRDLDGVATRLAAAYPETNANRGVQLFSLQDAALGPTRQLLIAIFTAVLLFLLVACANVINLQLVRATSRRREIALRIAVGADRSRLLRQLVIEGLTLATIGAVAGLTLAVWGLGSLLPLLPNGVLPRYATPSLDWRVLLFATVLTLVCGVLFGLAPALQTRRLAIADSLKEGARAAAGGITSLRRFGMQQMLVMGEVALALILLVGGGLMVRSLQRELAVEPGFKPDRVFTAQISLPRGRYPVPARALFANRLVERLKALPQIEAAAIGSDMPFGGATNGAGMYIDGVTDAPVRYYRHRVTHDYFSALGIPLLRGRLFTAADRDSAALVAVISDATARRFWPGTDAIGERIRMGDATGPEATVVGIVGTARFRDLTTNLASPRSEPDVFFAFDQRTDVDLSLIVRARPGTTALLPAIQRELTAIDAGVPLYASTPMRDLIDQQTARSRFGSALLGTFSVVALALAAVGIYGVLAFVIGLSRREIAIRMALGATRGRVVGLIVRQGMTLVGMGLVVGLVGAYFATEAMAYLAGDALASQLFGVSTTDPVTFVAVPVLLLLVALLASYLPSRAAARIDPQLALKGD